jgi:hypothetical protein
VGGGREGALIGPTACNLRKKRNRHVVSPHRCEFWCLVARCGCGRVCMTGVAGRTSTRAWVWKLVETAVHPDPDPDTERAQHAAEEEEKKAGTGELSEKVDP